MNMMGKTGIQVGLVLLAGGALMLSGGVASAMPGTSPPEARAECAVMQLPGMDMQLGEPGACLSVLLPPRSVSNPVATPTAPTPVGDVSPPAPVGNTSPPAPVSNLGAPAPVGGASAPAPVGNASAPAPRAGLPYPCLDVNLPGIRINIGEASPPTQCFVAPTV